MADVAGVCDSTGRVLGLMPHPKRHLDPTHHPRWTRGKAGPVGDGLQVFINAVRYLSDLSQLLDDVTRCFHYDPAPESAS